MHAMGTRAIARMVDRACRETPWTEGPVPYVRIEHVTAPSEESIRRAADHGIAFVNILAACSNVKFSTLDILM